ncbi:MAG: J domain-containing protein [Rhodospirillales bacterium]
MRDPYDVLGIAKGSETAEVKKAYRKLARKLHPDLHPGDHAAEERFKEVASAYDFLSDADKKTRYDKGEIDAAGQPKMERRFYRDFAEGGPAGQRYADPNEIFSNMEGMGVFADLFGGGARRGAAPKIRGQDIRETIEVAFLEAINGAQREISFADGRRLKVTIPAGSADGRVLRLKGQGQPSPTGGQAGDLLLEIKVLPHPIFTRQDNNITAELPISLGEAILGGKVEAPTVDGPVSLTIPKNSNTGSRLRVRGKGVPLAGGGRGDHYVTLKVVLPDPPDPALTAFIEGWAPQHPYRPRES